MKLHRTITVAWLLASVCCVADAQAVWRCSEAGRTSYRDTPCPSAGTPVDVGEAPDAARVTQAQARAREEAAMAQRWAQERVQRERQHNRAAPPGPAGFSLPPPALGQTANEAAREAAKKTLRRDGSGRLLPPSFYRPGSPSHQRPRG